MFTTAVVTTANCFVHDAILIPSVTLCIGRYLALAAMMSEVMASQAKHSQVMSSEGNAGEELTISFLEKALKVFHE